MKKLIVLLLVIFVFISCNDYKDFIKSDLQIIKNCISEIKLNNPFVDSCYIIKPNFTLNSTHRNQEEIKKRLLLGTDFQHYPFENGEKWDSISRIKNFDLSVCEKSEFVFSFSDIAENHILVLLEYKHGQVHIDQISEIESFENNAWDLYLLKVDETDSVEIVDLYSIQKN